MKKYLIPWIIIIGGVVVFALWVGWAYVSPGNDLPAQGQFGDKYGALNTLFTGLAFVGVIAALWHDRDGAEDREREHDELLAAMKAQAAASAETTRITAIIARIAVYDQQISNTPRCTQQDRMIEERHSLYLLLDQAYQTPSRS